MTIISKRTGHFTEADIDEEIVVMRLDNGEFYSLAGTAATTWRLIDGTRDRTALIDELAANYDCDKNEIAADLDDFLEALEGMGLIGTA